MAGSLLLSAILTMIAVKENYKRKQKPAPKNAEDVGVEF
jgi:hypothetical protein